MESVKTLLEKYYRLPKAEVQALVGYASRNYRVKAKGKNYVLKGYELNPKQTAQITAENELLNYLNEPTPGKFPQPITNHTQQSITLSNEGENAGVYRLLTYLEGAFLSDVEHTTNLFNSLGAFLAHMDQQLLHFYHPVIAARRISWDLQHMGISQSWQKYISNPADRKVVQYFFQQYQRCVVPHLYHLRRSVIHNDANDWNILVNNDEVTGIIDFGDTVYSPLIHELAIALTYALMGKDDPIEWALPIVKAYHQTLPLEQLEADLLYQLVAARLCQSVCHSAKAKTEQPDNAYMTVSEEAAWALLHCWTTINPTLAKNAFRDTIEVTADPVMPLDQVMNKRHQNISQALSVSYETPIYMEGAAFQYMYDRYGNTYLDAYNNIPHVGHSHPKVVEAANKQMAALNTNTRYLYDELNKYSESLLSKFPATLSKVFLVNSGSAASDLALRLALNYTGHKNIVVMEHGYHGNTLLGIQVSHYKYQSKGGKGPSDHILSLPLPDTYRGKYKNNDGSAGKAYALEAIDLMQKQGAPIAAFIAEPIVGCGGQVPLARGYLKEIYPFIRAQGGLCISDEVQTGFGRLGKYFWGYEQQEVVPDIVVLGKPMGNGHPIGAVVTSTAISEAFDNGMEFFSSFGGNPVSCAIGQAVLNTLDEEQLPDQAYETGEYFKKLLHQLKALQPSIGDIRGEGLFLGIELIEPNTNHPNGILAQKIKNQLREKYILVSTDGPSDNVIKMKPPLCFSSENAEQVVEVMDGILRQYK